MKPTRNIVAIVHYVVFAAIFPAAPASAQLKVERIFDDSGLLGITVKDTGMSIRTQDSECYWVTASSLQMPLSKRDTKDPLLPFKLHWLKGGKSSAMAIRHFDLGDAHEIDDESYLKLTLSTSRDLEGIQVGEQINLGKFVADIALTKGSVTWFKNVCAYDLSPPTGSAIRHAPDRIDLSFQANGKNIPSPPLKSGAQKCSPEIYVEVKASCYRKTLKDLSIWEGLVPKYEKFGFDELGKEISPPAPSANK